ncbi:MAG: RnfH family protein [Gammaproteobacteria bacterium]
MGNVKNIQVEVAYALAAEQIVLPLHVPVGTTLGEAIALSGMLKRYPDINLLKNKVGVFGKVRELDYVLKQGDRVEIYRPLIADPKEARRRRAAEAKKRAPSEP